MQIVVNDLLVHYEKQGSGPLILLMHGWADRLETFNAIIPKLTQQYTVISLDLPGFGQSQAPNEVWDLDNYARFVADFLKKANADKNIAAIIGHSNGGALAIRGLSLGVFTTEKLILLSASGVRNTDKLKRLAVKLLAKTGKVATFWMSGKNRKKLQKKLYGTVGSDMLVKPELQETFKKTVSQDIQADAAKIKVPTLLIYGDQDRATPVQKIGLRLNSLIPDPTLKIIAGAEHFAHQTNPHQVIAYIMDFLQ